ncbi:MAG TPA: non-canonical purine NTP pyrophosphatase [Hyphomicrobiaceae bacterium]|nr:non-canonical purine NTP pyrophosphatase [Hyphomicrobiaceae bacterium]
MTTTTARQLKRGDTLVVASHNKGKVREIGELIAPYGVKAVSAGDLGLPEPDETGTMFASNARIKSRAAAHATGLPALSDDSGICVEALDGAPGIFSARWGGAQKDFGAAMARVERELRLRDVAMATKPRAHFVSALALSFPDGEDRIYEGRVFGHLVWPPRGTQGFGYDPMFVPDGGALTFGEMEPHAKHAISHRARAFAAFVAACFEAG